MAQKKTLSGQDIRANTCVTLPLDPAVERAFLERRFRELATRNLEQDRYINTLRARVSSLEKELALAHAEPLPPTSAPRHWTGRLLSFLKARIRRLWARIKSRLNREEPNGH